jgi:hypothetical protein
MNIRLDYQMPKQTTKTVRYEMRRTEESELMGGKSENAVQQYFSLTYRGKQKDLYCFDYEVTGISQTNRKGLYAWVEDIRPLMKNLQLGISREGRIEEVFNRPDIHARWLRKGWDETKKKHREEENCEAMLNNIDALLGDSDAFAGALRYAPPFSLIFSGLNGMVFEKDKEEKRTGRVTGFAGAPYLPLILEDEIRASENPGESYEIKTVGKIDEKLFDRKFFGNFVRELSDDPAAADDLSTRHGERYLFDDCRLLKSGIWMHLSVVPYFMMREERCFIKSLES